MRWSTLGQWAIVGATTLGAGCALVVGFPDRTLASSGGGGAGASVTTGAGGDAATASSGGGGHGGAETTASSSGSASSGSAGGGAATSSADAGSSSTGGASTYCDTLAPKPLFCDDFEGAPLAQWGTVMPANGKVAVSTAQSTPAPGHSLEVRLDGGTPVDNLGHAYKTFGATYASMHLGFDMYVDQIDATDTTYLAEIEIGSDLGALIYYYPGALKVQQKYPPGPTFGSDIGTGHNVTLQQWTHVDLALALVDGGTSTVTLKVDGSTLIDAAPLVSAWGTGQPTIDLGDVIINKASPRAVYYDNVVFDAQ